MQFGKNKLFPPKLFKSKAKENLRNLFEAGRNSASIKKNAITNLQKTKRKETTAQKGLTAFCAK